MVMRQMKQRIEYKICTSPNKVDLELQVNELLNKGWELLGAPFVTGEYTLNQAMTFKHLSF